jgi:thymidylate kinase
VLCDLNQQAASRLLAESFARIETRPAACTRNSGKVAANLQARTNPEKMSADTTRILLSVFEAFEANDIPVVVLRNHEQLPQNLHGDLDILLTKNHLLPAEKSILGVAANQGWRILHFERVSNHCQIVLWKPNPEAPPSKLHIDLQFALGRKGFMVAESPAFLRERQYAGPFPIPQPDAKKLALAVHCLFDKHCVSPKYRAQLETGNATISKGFASSVLPAPIAPDVCDWLQRGAPDADVEGLVKSLRRKLRLHWPANLVRPGFVRLKRWIRMFGRRRGMLAAFVGPDGAGKSTVIRTVEDNVEPGAFPVKNIYMGKRSPFLPTSHLIRLIYKKKSSNEGDPSAPRRSGKKSGLGYRVKDVLGLLNFILDHWSRYLIQVRPLLQQGGVVLADRYAYDFGNHDLDSVAHRPAMQKILVKLLPVPDRTFMLWETPEVLWERKQEATKEDSALRIAQLRRLMDVVPGSRQVQTRGPAEKIGAGIVTEIFEAMEARNRFTHPPMPASKTKD